eukprot:754933-Hanusia_phi.AAC.2
MFGVLDIRSSGRLILRAQLSAGSIRDQLQQFGVHGERGPISASLLLAPPPGQRALSPYPPFPPPVPLPSFSSSCPLPLLYQTSTTSLYPTLLAHTPLVSCIRSILRSLPRPVIS